MVRPENRFLVVAVVSDWVRDRREARDVDGEVSLTGAAESVNRSHAAAQALLAIPAASVDPAWVNKALPAVGVSSPRRLKLIRAACLRSTPHR